MKHNTVEFTVIIPTRNRADVLKLCLEALSHQTYDSELFEIIVSDDGSEDNTRDVVEKFAGKSQIEVVYTKQKGSGASAARNRAISVSRGRILLFINDDTIVSDTAIEEHSKYHNMHPEENYAVLGRVTISPEVPYSIFSSIHLDAAFQRFDGRKELDWRAFITCNLSVKKSFLLKYGLFDESFRVLHEDIELGERLSRYGLKILYNNRALGYHYHHIREEDFLRSAEQDGQSLAVWLRKSPNLGKELASVGLYHTMPIHKRYKCFIADLLINKATIPFLLVLARYFAIKNRGLALMLYIKIYQAIKRESFRREFFGENRG
jgi:glycosyltransferase involved in cell wall biosynthesis